MTEQGKPRYSPFIPVDRRYSGVTTSPKDAPRVLRERRARLDAAGCTCKTTANPLCPLHGDPRDTSIDTSREASA